MDAEEVVRVYRTYHVGNFEESIRLFPGVPELLERLKAEGYALGLVTSRLTRTTRMGMEKYDLLRYFDSFVAEEDTEKPKPDPEPILLSLKNLGKASENAVMIGDTLHDIRCARNAGVLAGLVAWTLAAPESMRTGDDAPDFVIESFDELPEMLRARNGIAS
jgi:pyrophosphatase PpaX